MKEKKVAQNLSQAGLKFIKDNYNEKRAREILSLNLCQ